MRWAVAIMVLVSSLLAREAAAADTYAAIAFSQANGAHGYGYKAGDRAAAEEKALQECGPSCNVVMWVRNSCAALAVGRNNGYGTFRATDEDEAVEGANRECRKHTSGCELRRLVCSSY